MREQEILRSEIDGLAAEVMELKCQMADIITELRRLQNELQGNIKKAQNTRG